MKFIVNKTKNQNIWKVTIDGYNFKEDWIVFCSILGFDNPTDFIKHIYAEYESSNVTREFYVDELTKQCSGISGFNIYFSTKRGADDFAQDLARRLESV